MNIKRTLHILIAVILLAMAAAPMARAASEPRILQRRLDPDSNRLTLYVRHADGAAVSGVQIGGTEIADAAIARNAGETTVVTWILFDNSASMPEGVRAKAADLLTTLLGERGRGETYNFCVFSDRLSVQLRDSGSFADLKKRIEDMEYHDQRTSLTNALQEVLTEESERTGTEFVRIVVISAGGDGVSVEQVMKKLRERLVSNIPVYAVGCSDGANADSLSELYALSERTYARHWDISEVGASDIAKIMRWEEIPVKASLTIPESLRTGSAQEIRVTFSDGSAALGAVIAENIGGGGDISDTPQEGGNMSGVPQESDTPQEGGNLQENDDVGDTPQEGVDNAPQENDDVGGVEQGDASGVMALCAVLILGLVGGGAFWTFRRKNKDKTVFVHADPLPVGDSQDGVQSFSDLDDGDGTFANGDSPFPTLCLQDINSPERRFSAPLRNRATIGRGEDNAISLGYDKSISRRHCEIYLQNNKLWIRDSNSSGGTYLGVERITNATELPNGAVIRLGHVSYKVEVR